MAAEGRAWSELSDADLVRFLEQQPRPPQGVRTQVYEAIAKRHAPDIHRYLARALLDEDAANDVGQTTFHDAVSLLERSKGPAEPAKLGGWLMNIAKNRIREHHRKQAPLERHEIRLSEGGTFEDVADQDNKLAAMRDDSVRLREVDRILTAVVATFEIRDQQIYQLRIGEKLEYDQIAERLEMHPKTAANRISLVQTMVRDGFYAYLLAQDKKTRCSKLAEILNKHAHRSGKFTAELRAEIAKHHGTCPTCQQCDTCAGKERVHAWEYAPALIPVVFAAAFRERIAQAIQQAAHSTPLDTHDNEQSPPRSGGAVEVIGGIGTGTPEETGSGPHPTSPPHQPTSIQSKPRRNVGVTTAVVAAVLAILAIIFWTLRPGLPPESTPSATSVRYAAIFEQRDGPPFVARHGLTSTQYQQTFDELVSQGFRPVQVNGYQVGGTDLYAAIFEQRDGSPLVARHGLTSAQYQQTFDELVSQGFRPVQVSGYEVGGTDRYAAIFEQRAGPSFVARHGLTSAQYQQTFDELVSQGFRPIQVSGYQVGGADRYAAIWEKTQGSSWRAVHGLTSAQYQQTFDELVGQGFRPVQVSGYEVG